VRGLSAASFKRGKLGFALLLTYELVQFFFDQRHKPRHIRNQLQQLCDNSIDSLVAFKISHFVSVGVQRGAAGSATNPLQPLSTWSCYNPTQFFGAGNFGNFPSDMLVLLGVNVCLIIASLIVFRKRDIPV
jgi:hypothetical protein